MAPTPFTIALAQLNSTVGDVEGNAAKVRDARRQAAALGADLVVFPALFLSGSPCHDLALQPAFQDACREACAALARETADGGPAVVIGLPWRDGERLHDACAVLDEGRITALRFKVALPDDDDRDEKRVFAPGPLPGPVNVRGIRLGLPIGEDIGSEDVVECLAETGAEILVSPAGSPYRRGVRDERLNAAVRQVTESGLPLLHLNAVGGQDERVFDGASFVLNADSSLAGQLPAFREAVVLTRWERVAGRWTCTAAPRETIEEGDAADYAACMLGLRDFVLKSGRSRVLLALSGEPGPALCAAMAVDALGPERVHAVTLHSRQASQASLDGAVSCARALGIRHDILTIDDAVDGIASVLRPLSRAGSHDGQDDTLRSRTRGAMLMLLADGLDAMVVAAGDRSASALGLASPDRDGQGGFAPLEDLYRTEVARLAVLRNHWRPAGALGPEGVVVPVETEPGRPGAGLPPDRELDAILRALVEDGMRVVDIAALGHDAGVVERVAGLVALAGPGRRGCTPGVRLARTRLGRERRLPIVNRFRDDGRPAHRPDPAVEGGIGRPQVASSDV